MEIDVPAVSRRGLILLAASVAVVLGLAVWGGSCLGAARAKTEDVSVKSELTRVQSASAVIQRDVTALREQLSAAETDLSQAQASNAGLRKDNTLLRTQLASTEAELSRTQSQGSSLQQDNSTLRSQYGSVQQENASLRAQLASLKSDYDSLMARYGALEKAKEFVVDGRLRVRLTTEVQMGTVTWVRGEVTNTGATIVQRVYVLVSRYKLDGSLDRLDLPPAVIMNLVPGGVGYFSFLTAGESTKVAVLGDY